MLFNCLGQTNYGGRSLSTAESPNCRYDCQSFQVMRIFEPNWEKRTASICNIANMMNMAVAGSPMNRKTMLMLLSMKHLTSRSFVKNPAGLVALPVTPAMNGKIWPVE